MSLHTMKDGTINICWACHRPGDYPTYPICVYMSGCSHFPNGEYLHIYNQVAKIHEKLGLLSYYTYNLTSVLENSCAIDLIYY